MAVRLSRPRPAALAAATLAGLALSVALAATPARAGFLDFLFGGDKEPQYAPPPSAVPRQPIAPRGPSTPVTPSLPSQRAYCVRTCDGYYFAVGFVRNRAQQADDEQMCASSCGNREMRLYTAPVQHDPKDTGAAIERAIDANGEGYVDLPAANAFRTTENAACTCEASANGLPQIPIDVDPTLRDGDIVVTSDGLKVFHGAKATPHTEQDFIGVADAKSLPDVVRQQMLSLQNRIAQ